MKFEFKKPVMLKINGVTKSYIGVVEFADEVVERENFVQRFAKFPNDIIAIEEATEVEETEVEQPQRKNKKK